MEYTTIQYTEYTTIYQYTEYTTIQYTEYTTMQHTEYTTIQYTEYTTIQDTVYRVYNYTVYRVYNYILVRGVFRGGAMGAQPPPPGKVKALIFRGVSAPNRGWAPPPVKKWPISTAPLFPLLSEHPPLPRPPLVYVYCLMFCFMILISFDFKFPAVLFSRRQSAVQTISWEN